MEAVISEIPGVVFFVSTITGTAIRARTSGVAATHVMETYPALGYWVVGHDPLFDQRDLYLRMEENGLGATLKHLHHKGQRGLSDEVSMGLYMVVKDHGSGFIRRKVDYSAAECLGIMKPKQHPIVKFCVKDDDVLTLVETAQSRLADVRFEATVEIV